MRGWGWGQQPAVPPRSRGARAAPRSAEAAQPGSSGAALSPGPSVPRPPGPGTRLGFSPATQRRDTRGRCRCMRLADLAWEGLGAVGEAAFEPAQPVVN